MTTTDTDPGPLPERRYYADVFPRPDGDWQADLHEHTADGPVYLATLLGSTRQDALDRAAQRAEGHRNVAEAAKETVYL